MEEGSKVMLTFLVFLFNHLAYRKHVEYMINHPDVETKFTGIGCLGFFSIPADVYLITLMIG